MPTKTEADNNQQEESPSRESVIDEMSSLMDSNGMPDKGVDTPDDGDGDDSPAGTSDKDEAEPDAGDDDEGGDRDNPDAPAPDEPADSFDEIPARLVDAAVEQQGWTKQALAKLYAKDPGRALDIMNSAFSVSARALGDNPARKQGETAKDDRAVDLTDVFAGEFDETTAKNLASKLGSKLQPLFDKLGEYQASESKRQRDEQVKLFASAADKVFNSDEKFYGKGPIEKLSRSERNNRMEAAKLADALISGTRANGGSIDFEKAFDLAHRAVSFNNARAAAREDISKSVRDRSGQRTVAPSKTRGSSSTPANVREATIAKMAEIMDGG